MKKILTILLFAVVTAEFAWAVTYLYPTSCENPMELVLPKQETAAATSTIYGIPYANTTDPDQQLDLYLPIGTNFPTVVFIHGGSWTSGNKEMYANIGKYFQSQGIACAVINYRLSPKVVHPAHAQDCAAATAWTIKNINKYGGNNKIFLIGHSAGGHLASLICTDEKYLAAQQLSTKNVSGVVSISGLYLINYNVNFYGIGYVFRSVGKADASPINHVQAGLPPYLLFVADADIPTFEKQAKNFQAALNKYHNQTNLILCKNQTHSTIVINLFTQNNPYETDIINFIRGRI